MHLAACLPLQCHIRAGNVITWACLGFFSPTWSGHSFLLLHFVWAAAATPTFLAPLATTQSSYARNNIAILDLINHICRSKSRVPQPEPSSLVLDSQTAIGVWKNCWKTSVLYSKLQSSFFSDASRNFPGSTTHREGNTSANQPLRQTCFPTVAFERSSIVCPLFLHFLKSLLSRCEKKTVQYNRGSLSANNCSRGLASSFSEEKHQNTSAAPFWSWQLNDFLRVSKTSISMCHADNSMVAEPSAQHKGVANEHIVFCGKVAWLSETDDSLTILARQIDDFQAFDENGVQFNL